MIKMISSIPKNGVAKQKKLAASENGETMTPENKNKKFAALFQTPADSAKGSNEKSVKKEDEKSLDADSPELNSADLNQNNSVPVSQSAAKADSSENAAQQTPDAQIEFSKVSQTKEQFSYQSLAGINQANLPGEHTISAKKGILSEEARKLIKTSMESGRMEVVSSHEKAADSAVAQADFSTASTADLTKGKDAAANPSFFPNLFKEVSSVFSNDNKKTGQPKPSDPAFDFSAETADIPENVLTQNLTKSNSETSTGLAQSQTPGEATESSKQSDAADSDFLTIGFERSMSAAAKAQNTNETSAAAPTADKAETVFNQVEPKMLQLLNFQRTENEKKTMKMRLHPAELGTVEIKLEKDSSGKLRAHFQTESEATRQILTESLDQLRDSLQNSGWQVEHLEISCGSFSSTSHGDHEGNSRSFETSGNQLKTQPISDDPSENQDGSSAIQSNRLLSVRA